MSRALDLSGRALMPAGVFETIVVGTDFSDPADRALDVAAELGARTGGATLLLVHAHFVPLELGAMLQTGMEDLFGDIETSARAELAKRTESLASRGLHVESVARDGAADEVITEVARERGADLVVVGTHGRTGFSHLVIGSVAERVLRHAPCPTLTVHPGD